MKSSINNHLSLDSNLRKQLNTTILFYSVYCLGTFVVSIGVSTMTGAIRGLVVVTPLLGADSSEKLIDVARQQSIYPNIFLLQRSVSCVLGAVRGAYEGANDAKSIIMAPWFRLFGMHHKSNQIAKVNKEVAVQTVSKATDVIEKSEIQTNNGQALKPALMPVSVQESEENRKSLNSTPVERYMASNSSTATLELFPLQDPQKPNFRKEEEQQQEQQVGPVDDDQYIQLLCAYFSMAEDRQYCISSKEDISKEEKDQKTGLSLNNFI